MHDLHHQVDELGGVIHQKEGSDGGMAAAVEAL